MLLVLHTQVLVAVAAHFVKISWISGDSIEPQGSWMPELRDHCILSTYLALCVGRGENSSTRSYTRWIVSTVQGN